MIDKEKAVIFCEWLEKRLIQYHGANGEAFTDDDYRQLDTVLVAEIEEHFSLVVKDRNNLMSLKCELVTDEKGNKGYMPTRAHDEDAGFDLYWSPATGYNSPTVQQGNAISKNVGYDHYFYDPNDPENPLNNITSKNGRLISTSSGMQNTAASTLYLYKGDYLKLKNLTVGYTFPKKWTNYANISKLRLYVSAENLLTITSFPWMDPEMSSRTGYPTLKQFTLGVNVTF